MNGPEHYRAAERLLVQADKGYSADRQENPEAEFNLRLAQVHATLAHAAAAALWPAAGASAVSLASMPEMVAWLEVCAVDPGQVKR